MNSMYDFTVPIFINSLGGLKNVLAKAGEAGLSEEALLEDRLASDMFPFVKQIRVACDNAKGAAGRLAGMEAPKHEDTERSLAELMSRIDATIAFLESVPAENFADAARRSVTLPYFPGKYLTGFDYAREYAIPNFFFHVSMAYAIARKNGVALGKADYINRLELRDIEKASA